MGHWNGPVVDGSQSISNLTIDGDNHSLNLGIDANSRSNLEFFNITIKDCAYSALALNGPIPAGALWPKSINDTANAPSDENYISNIKIYDSNFLNSGGPGGSDWAYGTIQLKGIRDSSINRVLIDESTYGGFNIKGGWLKRFNISKCDCRQAASSPSYGGKGYSIELSETLDTSIFDVTTNGGISLVSADKTSVHHNRIVMPAEEKIRPSIEFIGFRSSIISNYFEGGQGLLIYSTPTITTGNIGINHNTFSGTVGGIFIASEIPQQSIKNISIDNNTFDQVTDLYSGGTIYAQIREPSATIADLSIRNNIFSNSKPGAYGATGRAITLTGKDSNPTLSPNIFNTKITGNVFFNNIGGDIVANQSTNTTTARNKLHSNPLFSGIGPAPSPYYRIEPLSPAVKSGDFIGLPFLGNGPPDSGSFIQIPNETIEAEMNYSLKSDNGIYSIGWGGMSLASGAHAVQMFDANDTIRIHFQMPAAGQYILSIRLRSGYASNPTSYLNSYTFALDGTPIAMGPGFNNISQLDPSGGGVYWGSLTGQSPLTLSAGPHSLEVKALAPWSFIDSLTVMPIQ